MIYNVNFSTGKLEAIDATDKNDLPVGTVLHLNGYNNPDSAIVGKLGIDNQYGYGAKYQTVSLEDFHYSQEDAYQLEWLKDKSSGKIQTYITDRILTADEVRDLKAKADAKKAASDAYQERAKAERERLSEIGKALFAKHIPAGAQALIVAERHKDESDLMTDYFAHTTTETIIIGYSMHKKDLFSEMRKAAARIPETKHLGPGKGHFEPRVMIGADIFSNGSAYWKGSYSHWHRELTQNEKGNAVFFHTREEAEKYIQEKGEPETISFDGVPIPFYWEIEEKKIEHREKYSMGAGYYLKDGHSDSSGWCVSKQGKFRGQWDDGLFVSMGKRCIFEVKAEAIPDPIPDREKIASTAFWGGNEPLAELVRNKNSYEMDGQTYPANSLSKEDYQKTVADMTDGELKPFLTIPEKTPEPSSVGKPTVSREVRRQIRMNKAAETNYRNCKRDGRAMYY